MTRYVLLREADAGLWEREGDAFEARSADAALRDHAPTDGVWAAVPVRHWRPTLVETETRPVRSLSAAEPARPGA